MVLLSPAVVVLDGLLVSASPPGLVAMASEFAHFIGSGIGAGGWSL